MAAARNSEKPHDEHYRALHDVEHEPAHSDRFYTINVQGAAVAYVCTRMLCERFPFFKIYTKLQNPCVYASTHETAFSLLSLLTFESNYKFKTLSNGTTFVCADCTSSFCLAHLSWVVGKGNCRAPRVRTSIPPPKPMRHVSFVGGDMHICIQMHAWFILHSLNSRKKELKGGARAWPATPHISPARCTCPHGC